MRLLTCGIHADELRERVLVGALAAAVGILGCFCFSKDLVVFLEVGGGRGAVSCCCACLLLDGRMLAHLLGGGVSSLEAVWGRQDRGCRGGRAAPAAARTW